VCIVEKTANPSEYEMVTIVVVKHEPQTHELPTTTTTLVDDSFRYCHHCLASFQAGVTASLAKTAKSSQTVPLSKVTKYSMGTATSAMILHLFYMHNISLSRAKSSTAFAPTGDLHGQPKPSFSGSGSRPSASASLNEALLKWLAMDNLPFSTVDTPAFRELFLRQLPKINLPSSDTLRLSTLPNVYSTMKTTVARMLFSASTLCLMFDGWSDKHNARHFLGIRASIITDNWVSMVLTLSCKQCPQDTAGIKEHIAAELYDLGLTPDVLKDKLVFTTHDGASVMLKTSRLLNSKYSQHCCSHALHLLLMTDGINKIPALRELLRRCKNIVTKLHFGGDIVEQEMQKTCATETVDKLCSQIAHAFEIVSCDNNMPISSNDNGTEALVTDNVNVEYPTLDRAYRRLQQEVVTRWNSAVEMINSLFTRKNEVNEALKRTGNHNLLLKTLDWNTLSQLSGFLTGFKTLTEVASEGTVGLSIVPLIRAKVTAACRACDTDVDEMAELKRRILAGLDVRFQLNDFILAATLLDPASKNKKYLNMNVERKRDLLLRAIQKAQWGMVVTSVGPESPSVAAGASISASEDGGGTCKAEEDQMAKPTKPKRLCVMEDFEDDNSEEDVVSAVMQYLSSNEKPTDEELADPLLYWKNSKCTALANVARIYLTANASSVPCEAMFSVCGMVLNGRRSSLAPHTFNRLIFIHENGRLGLQD